MGGTGGKSGLGGDGGAGGTGGEGGVACWAWAAPEERRRLSRNALVRARVREGEEGEEGEERVEWGEEAAGESESGMVGLLRLVLKRFRKCEMVKLSDGSVEK